MTATTNLMEASNQWRDRPADQRFETLDALRAKVHGRRIISRSVDIDLPKLQTSVHDGELVVNSAIAPVTPTHWGFSQFAGWLGAPAGYLRKLPVQLASDCLNHGIEKADRETLKFMTLAPEDSARGSLAAVTSQTYGRIWDADVVDACARIVERSGGKFHNPLAYDMATGQPKPSGLYASDHDCFMFMIDGGSRLEVGPRAILNRGFFLWNSEVGARSFGLTTFLFNTVCGNHIVWGAQDVSKLVIRHTANGPYRFDSEAFQTLKGYIDSGSAPEVEAIRGAQTLRLKVAAGADNDTWETEPGKVLAGFARSRGVKLTTSEITNAIETAKKEEGQCETLWDFVQGLTAYARGFDFIDSRIDLERRAGSLLKITA